MGSAGEIDSTPNQYVQYVAAMQKFNFFRNSYRQGTSLVVEHCAQGTPVAPDGMQRRRLFALDGDVQQAALPVDEQEGEVR